MNREPREARLLWPALWRLALAGAVFIGVYGFCNHYTASRGDVPQLMFEWERNIPFVREMVVPYWSLDLFFCGAFFLCRSRVELDLLTKRLVVVTLATGICFLLFPLQLALPRPEPEGWTAPLFHALYFNDLPYNLAPSLHISLRSLVWVFYGAHLTGWLRRAVKTWFILIGLSTLLVWQHHLIDVASGFLMGWIIAALIPDPRQLGTRTVSLKLAARYGVGALVSGVLSFAWLGFIWPATALGIVSLAYATGLSRLLGKENGTLSPSAEWCLLPVLLTTSLIQRKWMKGKLKMHEIRPGVWFGRKPTSAEANALAAGNDLAVLDLTAEGNAPTAFRERALYRNVPMLDLVPPSAESVSQAIEFIRCQQPNRRVFIHCKLGLQRSATVAAHWLVACGKAQDLVEAAEMVRKLEPRVVL